MAAEEAMVGGGDRRALAAILLMGASTNAYDAYSAVMSSPWTTQKLSANPEDAAAARFYVKQAIVMSMAYSIAAGVIAHSAWPVVGGLAANGYMFYLYERALRNAGQ